MIELALAVIVVIHRYHSLYNDNNSIVLAVLESYQLNIELAII
jgi:hypothetical protein